MPPRSFSASPPPPAPCTAAGAAATLAQLQAARLLDEHGPEARQRAEEEEARARLSGDPALARLWNGVGRHLAALAARGAEDEVAATRRARLLIAAHGPQEAWHRAMQQVIEREGEPAAQSVWLRVGAAVAQLEAEATALPLPPAARMPARSGARPAPPGPGRR